MSSPKLRDYRCPIHGFITVDEFENSLVEHPYFQRLRRIRQLAWTDIVYPGAMHTRFEHSLGVMHVASRMFDEIWRRRPGELAELGFSDKTRERDRAVLRVVALLHDIGHSPFSHVGEGLMATKSADKKFSHEDYSVALIRRLDGLIDGHDANKMTFRIKAAEVADMLDDKTADMSNLFWRQLMSSQLDADRADYLLRDSHHLGVQYGHYDLNRLLISLTVARDPETEDPILAVEEGGWHTAEALILARYMMFSQVYYHKTRSIYDVHVTDAMRELLLSEQASTALAEKDKFPPPTSITELDAYFKWDDWRVLGLLQSGGGGAAGDMLRERNHHRLVFESGGVDTKTSSTLPPAEKKRFQAAAKQFEKVKRKLGKLVAHEDDSGRSWYKPTGEIMIALGEPGTVSNRLVPLSEISPVVRALKKERVHRLYVRPEDKKKADKLVREALL